MMINNYILILIAVLFAAGGQLSLKKGAIIDSNILAIFQNHFTWIGLFCYFFSAILWIVALSKMKLSYVYPFTFMTYILVMSGAYFLLGERINIINLLVGSTLVILGIIILNLR